VDSGSNALGTSFVEARPSVKLTKVNYRSQIKRHNLVNEGVAMGQDDEPVSQPRRRVATVLESVDELRAHIAHTSLGGNPLVRAGVPSPNAAGPDDTRPFRPSCRPPMAILTVLDDGEDVGEMIRIRSDLFVIGRVRGDLVIEHDSGISGQHAEISRQMEGSNARWCLKDLQSTNGTFVRVSSSLLKHGQELLIGCRRLMFEGPSLDTSAEEKARDERTTTRKWQNLSKTDPAGGTPTLVEITPLGAGRRHPLKLSEQWLGRDPHQCAIVLDDPMTSPVHAKFSRSERGQWVVTNARSMNGVWARVAEIALDRGGQFQCGEQRFIIKILQ
jgi:pSer/pThr/pTyr-binding forkhead associated (FHA) protein